MQFFFEKKKKKTQGGNDRAANQDQVSTKRVTMTCYCVGPAPMTLACQSITKHMSKKYKPVTITVANLTESSIPWEMEFILR